MPAGPDDSLLAQILAEVTDGVVAFDLDFRFTYLNAAAEKIFSRTAEELVGNELWSELPSLLETTFGSACRRSMEQRMPITVEGFLPPFDAWFEAPRSRRRTAWSCLLARRVGAVQARQANERLMRELSFERARLEAILRQMPSGALLDGGGRLLMANAQFERVSRTDVRRGRHRRLRRVRGVLPDGTRVKPDEWPLARSLVTGEPTEARSISCARDGARITTAARRRDSRRRRNIVLQAS